MTVRDKVELILKHDVQARSSDKRLLIIFMQKHDMDLSEEQMQAFYAMPSLETVRRERQTLNSEGLYPATAKVQQERAERAENMRGGGYLNPEEVLEHVPDDRPMKVIIDELFPE